MVQSNFHITNGKINRSNSTLKGKHQLEGISKRKKFLADDKSRYLLSNCIAHNLFSHILHRKFCIYKNYFPCIYWHFNNQNIDQVRSQNNFSSLHDMGNMIKNFFHKNLASIRNKNIYLGFQLYSENFNMLDTFFHFQCMSYIFYHNFSIHILLRRKILIKIN